MKKAIPWIVVVVFVVFYFAIPYINWGEAKYDWWKEIDNEQDLYTYLYEDHLDSFLNNIDEYKDISTFIEIIRDKWPEYFDEGTTN